MTITYMCVLCRDVNKARRLLGVSSPTSMYIARICLCIRYVTGSFGGFGLDREHARVTVVKPVHGIAICLSCIYEVECHLITYVYFIADSLTRIFQTLLARAYYSPFNTYSRSSPSGKAAGEDVPMDDNPA